MKLLIISNMAHYRDGSQIVGWGPTVQEINHLANIFEEIRHLACLHEGKPPPSSLSYSSSRISLVPITPAGGPSLLNKINILRLIPLYIFTILRELPNADIVHVRCPANIGMVAIVLLSLLRHPRKRWIKYAGNWRPDRSESWSYTFQRWWLHRNLAAGKVTINGSWVDQKPHEMSFPNPCLTKAELEEAVSHALKKKFTPPYRCVFVGRLEKEKGAPVLLDAVRQLTEEGLQLRVDFVGDGPQSEDIVTSARDLSNEGIAIFHGWIPRNEVVRYYKNAHFVVLPTSCSEGWPKVLSEGMAYGAVPIATAISAIPHYLIKQKNSWLLDNQSSKEVAAAIKWFVDKSERWYYCRNNAMSLTDQFTYEYYIDQIEKLILFPESAS